MIRLKAKHYIGDDGLAACSINYKLFGDALLVPENASENPQQQLESILQRISGVVESSVISDLRTALAKVRENVRQSTLSCAATLQTEPCPIRVGDAVTQLENGGTELEPDSSQSQLIRRSRLQKFGAFDVPEKKVSLSSNLGKRSWSSCEKQSHWHPRLTQGTIAMPFDFTYLKPWIPS